MQQCNIIRAEGDRNRPPVEDSLNPLCMVCMPVSKTDPDQAKTAGFQYLDHGLGIVGCIHQNRLARIIDDVALHRIAADLAMNSLDPRHRREGLRDPLVQHDLFERREPQAERAGDRTKL